MRCVHFQWLVFDVSITEKFKVSRIGDIIFFVVAQLETCKFSVNLASVGSISKITEISITLPLISSEIMLLKLSVGWFCCLASKDKAKKFNRDAKTWTTEIMLNWNDYNELKINRPSWLNPLIVSNVKSNLITNCEKWLKLVVLEANPRYIVCHSWWLTELPFWFKANFASFNPRKVR